MKKTQIIHSPRTFKFGLGLIIAASLASMPVLTGASDRAEDAKAKSKIKTKSEARAAGLAESSSDKAKKAVSKSKIKSKKKTQASGARRTASATEPEARSKARRVKLETEAKKIAAKLTTTQKSKLLALLNDGDAEKLASIAGIGASRSEAIEKARPITKVEDLQKVKGVGPKTFAEVVDHGKSLTRTRKSSGASKSGTSKATKASKAPSKASKK